MAKSGPKGPWIKMTDKDFEKVVAMCKINFILDKNFTA